MILKVKKLNDMSVLPRYAKKGDAAMDLTCVSLEKKAEYFEYGTGLAVEIPEGYVGLLFPENFKISTVSGSSLNFLNSVVGTLYFKTVPSFPIN